MGVKGSKLFGRKGLGQTVGTSGLPYPQLLAHAGSHRALITLAAVSLASIAAPSVQIAHWPLQHLPVEELHSVSSLAYRITTNLISTKGVTEQGRGSCKRSCATSPGLRPTSSCTNDGHSCISGQRVARNRERRIRFVCAAQDCTGTLPESLGRL